MAVSPLLLRPEGVRMDRRSPESFRGGDEVITMVCSKDHIDTVISEAIRHETRGNITLRKGNWYNKVFRI